MPEITEASNWRVGDWVYQCCEHDLKRIDSLHELRTLQVQQEQFTDMGGLGYTVFPSRDEALAAIGGKDHA